MSSIVDKVKDKLQGGSDKHKAVLLQEKGKPLVVGERSTPTPDPNELIVEVKSVALNPVDHYQRDYGMMISQYPAVLASDVGGVVTSVGSSVSPTLFKKGTRVSTFATAFFYGGAPDYGALQKYVRVAAVRATPIPDNMSFSEASLLPMAVATTWAGLYTVGIPRNTAYSPADKQALLIWGGSSSVGTAVIQIAKLLGYSTYVTASSKHHDYLRTLGADKLFDYKDPNVAESIVKAAKEDGVKMEFAYHATGDVEACMKVLNDLNGSSPTHVAHAPIVPEGLKIPEGMKVTFVQAPDNADAQAEHFEFVFNKWLKEKLEKRQFVPAPGIEVIPGGLDAADKALDKLKAGASAVKYVIEVD